MTERDIVTAVNELLIEEFEIEASLLNPEATLAKDLDLDSIDRVDLVVALEKLFNIRIEEVEARSMKVLKDIYDYIDKMCKTLHDGKLDG